MTNHFCPISIPSKVSTTILLQSSSSVLTGATLRGTRTNPPPQNQSERTDTHTERNINHAESVQAPAPFNQLVSVVQGHVGLRQVLKCSPRV